MHTVRHCQYRSKFFQFQKQILIKYSQLDLASKTTCNYIACLHKFYACCHGFILYVWGRNMPSYTCTIVMVTTILYRVRLSPRAIQTWIVLSVQCIHMQFPKIALAWTTVNQFLYINTITCPCSHLLVKYRCPNTVLSSTKHF